MQENFKRILTITDFSRASFHAAEEAAMIASKFNSNLHILHVSSKSGLAWLLAPEAWFFHVAEDDKEEKRNNETRLRELKTELEERFGVDIEYHESRGKLFETIREYTDDLRIDLLVLGAKKSNWFKDLFFENKAKEIIRSVGCEVLCVYPDSNSSRLKKIVLPIGKFIPKRKIRLAYELAKKFAANVHLISLNQNGQNLNSEYTKTLMASYQYLKDITNIPIECRTVIGNNLAQATVEYAENIEADLILVNAGSESFFKPRVLRRWGGSIVNHSSIPVLSVHAINEKPKHKRYRA